MTNQLKIRKLAVLGAGVMGAQIAAHFANAGVKVFLFDLNLLNLSKAELSKLSIDHSDKKNKNAIADNAIKNLETIKPPPLADSSVKTLITPANYDDDLIHLKECDLIIEAIVEKFDAKMALYYRIAPFIKLHALLGSNTSGLSIEAMANQLPDNLKERFFGIHFFNPPRYMHAIELVASSFTHEAVLAQLESYLVQHLGKGIIYALDTPNFIANRIGFFSILSILAEGKKYQLGFDLIDNLTGKKIKRAKSATFRTADIIGLDTVYHVIKTLENQLKNDAFYSLFTVPPVIEHLINCNWLGKKTGSGFYRKLGKTIQVYDLDKNIYVKPDIQIDPDTTTILKQPFEKQLGLLRESKSPQAQFLWACYRDLFHYVAINLDQLASSARDVDFAMRWGFGWEYGPFESWQKGGWFQLAKWIDEDISQGKALCDVPLPNWVYDENLSKPFNYYIDNHIDNHADSCIKFIPGVHQAQGSYSPSLNGFVQEIDLPVYQRQVIRAQLIGNHANHFFLRRDITILFQNQTSYIWHFKAGQRKNVLIFSFVSKLNTINFDVVTGIKQAVRIAEEKFQALVIWQPSFLYLATSENLFSAGVNLNWAQSLWAEQGEAGLDKFLAAFQDALMKVKYSTVPVIGTVFGSALGGGCELLSHCARRIAHLESYIGLVESKIGLIPSGGGLKEVIMAVLNQASRLQNKHYLQWLLLPLSNVVNAKVSQSAYEAQSLGYLQQSDPIIFNVYELLDVAINQALAMAFANYRPPIQSAITLPNYFSQKQIENELLRIYPNNALTAESQEIIEKIAFVASAGNISRKKMSEELLLELERQAFIDLFSKEKTQANIREKFSSKN